MLPSAIKRPPVAPFQQADLLTWISAYWFTGTIETSFTTRVEAAMPVPYVPTPTGLSVFAPDTNPAPRSYASQFVNVQEFIEHENGGQLAAREQPVRELPWPRVLVSWQACST